MKKIKFLNGIGSMFAFAVVALVGSLLFTSCEKEDLNATFTTEPAKATINVNVVEFPSGAAVSGVTINADKGEVSGMVVTLKAGADGSIPAQDVAISATAPAGYEAIQSVTVQFVRVAGGGAAAWRTVAVVYAIIGVIVNTISVFSIKELPEEELKAGKDYTEEKYSLVEAAKLLFSNKYYLMICATYICQQIYSAMLNMGIYYMIYILKNEDLYSIFSWAINIPVIIAMCITPMLVEKMKGLYRMNLAGYILGTAGRVGVIFAGYMGSVPLMLAFTAVAALGMAPWQGDMGAVVASCSEYTYLTKHKHIDGTMYSCTSFGTKIGGGIGVALCGWLLDASGFVKEATIQPESCLNMLHVMYLWIPMVLSLVITFIMSRMNVEDANEKLRKQLERKEKYEC